MTNLQTIVQILDDLSVAYRVVHHQAVFTVAESSSVLAEKRAVKNLLVKEKGNGRKVLVVMDGHARLDLAALAEVLGTKKLSFASSDTLMRTLGVTPGSVSLFSLFYEGSSDVEVVIDESLLAEAELGFHPNDNTTTIFVPGAAVAQIVECANHTFRAMRLV
jgi:Ala-tRNA(Pro) deacylase